MLSEQHDLIWLINLLEAEGLPDKKIEEAVARYQGGDHRSHLSLLSPKARDAWNITMKSGDSRSNAKKLSKLDPELTNLYLASVGADASRTGAVTKSALDADEDGGDLVLDVMEPRHSLGSGLEDDGCGLWLWLTIGIVSAIILLVLGLWIFKIPPFAKSEEGHALQRTTWSSTDSGYAGADEPDEVCNAKTALITTAYSIPVLAGLYSLYGYFFGDSTTCPNGQTKNEKGICVPADDSLLPEVPGGACTYAGIAAAAAGLAGYLIPLPCCGGETAWQWVKKKWNSDKTAKCQDKVEAKRKAAAGADGSQNAGFDEDGPRSEGLEDQPDLPDDPAPPKMPRKLKARGRGKEGGGNKSGTKTEPSPEQDLRNLQEQVLRVNNLKKQKSLAKAALDDAERRKAAKAAAPRQSFSTESTSRC